MWITGNMKRQPDHEVPGERGELLTVSVTESSTRLEPEIEGSDIRFKLLSPLRAYRGLWLRELPMEEMQAPGEAYSGDDTQ